METSIPWIGVALGVVCLVFALRAGRRRRLVDHIPTSKTTGVFIGLVELKGTAEAEQPVIAFLSEKPCVYHSWKVEEHWSRTITETYKDSQGKTQTRTRRESGWTTVASGGQMMPFYLRDDCGAIRIQPGKAKIEPLTVFSRECSPANPLYYGKGPAGAIAHSDHRRRFTETAIPLHTPIYVMGQAREREDIVAPEIAYDKDAELFLISTRTEQQVRQGFAIGFWVWGVLGGILSVGGAALSEPTNAAIAVMIGVVYLLAWVIGWFVMVYNSLIGLKQRVSQAWSNVDVQLKRRADLIPNLIAAVQGIRAHEAETQTLVAALRNQLAATAPWKEGPDPAAVAPKLMALAESYPDLKANENFLNLQDNLVDTEHRIALARAYYNDIATFYNTRLEIIPDRFIAALARLTKRTLMAANEFERETVTVNFAN